MFALQTNLSNQGSTLISGTGCVRGICCAALMQPWMVTKTAWDSTSFAGHLYIYIYVYILVLYRYIMYIYIYIVYIIYMV